MRTFTNVAVAGVIGFMSAVMLPFPWGLFLMIPLALGWGWVFGFIWPRRPGYYDDY